MWQTLTSGEATVWVLRTCRGRGQARGVAGTKAAPRHHAVARRRQPGRELACEPQTKWPKASAWRMMPASRRARQTQRPTRAQGNGGPEGARHAQRETAPSPWLVSIAPPRRMLLPRPCAPRLARAVAPSRPAHVPGRRAVLARTDGLSPAVPPCLAQAVCHHRKQRGQWGRRTLWTRLLHSRTHRSVIHSAYRR